MYPKYCPHCEEKLTVEVTGRENAIRCPRCHYQGSRTSYTPLHHLKLPLWVFGYVLVEAVNCYPSVLSGAGIKRRLGVSNNTAQLLKRRLQLFLSDLIPFIKEAVKEDINGAFKEGALPEDPEVDVTDLVKGKPVVNMDTVALFSASQRANGGRKRHKHTGQTASIYLTDQVAQEKGKYQIGTLCHTMAIKQGAVILDSVPDQTQKSLKSLFEFLPKKAPIFTDDGYAWLKRYDREHRAVNHSARAKDQKRNVWARDRWSKKGVHNQVAEGFQRILKHAFISGYSYVSPKYSQLYLNEYSALKGLKVYGLDRLVGFDTGDITPLWGMSVNDIGFTSGRADHGYLQKSIAQRLYVPPTPAERVHANHSKSRKRIPKPLRELLAQNDYFDLKQAVWDYLTYWDEGPSGRKQKETLYNSYAHQLWSELSGDESKSLSDIARNSKLPYKQLYRITRIWAKLRIAEVKDIREYKYSRENYYIRKLMPILPDILYSFDRTDFESPPKEWEHIVTVYEKSKKTRTNQYGMSKEERKNQLKEASHEGK